MWLKIIFIDLLYMTFSNIIINNDKDFDITPQYLSQVIRDNNITRKRTRYYKAIIQ